MLRDAPPRLVTGQWPDKTPAAPWWCRRGGPGGQVLEQATHIFHVVGLLVGDAETVLTVEASSTRCQLPHVGTS